MKKITHTLIITALIMLSACGGRQTQTEGADAAAVDTKEVTAQQQSCSLSGTIGEDKADDDGAKGEETSEGTAR